MVIWEPGGGVWRGLSVARGVRAQVKVASWL